MLLVAAAQAGENPHRLLDRRLVDGDLLQPPRQRPILLDVLELLEGGRADDAQIAAGQQRLHQRREVHRAAGDGAGADRGVNFVDEEDRPRRDESALIDRLEPLFEVAAEAGAGEERAGVEREDLRRPSASPARRRRAAAWRALRPWPSCRRRRRRRTPDCSCGGGQRPRWCAAAPRCGRSADRAGPRRARAVRFVAVGRERIARGRRTGRRPCRCRRSPTGMPGVANGVLAIPCEMYSSTSSRVTPCSARRIAACALRLLQDRGEDVADVGLVALRALDVQHRGLQDAAERRRLLGLPVAAAPDLLDRLVEVFVQPAAQRAAGPRRRPRGCARRRYRAAARRADARASDTHGGATPPRDRRCGGRLQQMLRTWQSDQASSTTAFNGKPASRASDAPCRLWFRRLPTDTRPRYLAR